LRFSSLIGLNPWAEVLNRSPQTNLLYVDPPHGRQGDGQRTGKRVALLIHDLRGGGVERVTVSLANGFASCGLHVDLVMINKGGNKSYFESLSDAINVIELRQRRTLTSPIGFRKYFDAYRPDVVISAMTHINVAAILGNLAAVHHTRLIVVEHNQLSKNRKTKSFLVRLAYSVVPWAYRHAAIIGAVSVGVKADLAAATGLPLDRIAVLHNPVVIPSLLSQSHEILDHPWFADNEPPIILGVGRLTEQKNFDLLIDAFAAVRSKRPARLVILGQGPERDALEERATSTGWRKDIALMGFVKNPFPFMRRAAVFALSSKWEGLPTALIEAMACGAPIVATDCPSGPAEILRYGELGRLTPVGDVESFAEALENTLAFPPEREKLKERADDFSLERAIERYLSVAFPIDAGDDKGPAGMPLPA
jgi:glycosyltransferase involved in cell wall biosynthesis